MKKRIAILTNYPADFISFTGGVETAAAALLEGLRDHLDEFEFHLVSAPKGLRQDIRVQREGIYFHFLSVPSVVLARPRLPFRILRGSNELREISPDLVHCQDNMPFALAAILSKYPRLFTVHGVKRHEASKHTGWEKHSAIADALIERYVYEHFHSFICISDYAGRVIGDGKQLFRIPNAVRSAFFRVRRNGLNSPPMILFVGALVPLKRPMAILYAHRELRQQFPDLETILCGVAEDRNYFQQMQQQATEGVRFAGLVAEEELMYWLSRATALVLPSTQENLPIVIAEAMAAGVPVVAAPVGGVPEMVEHGRTGFLCSVDAGDLTKWLRRLLSDPVLQIEMGQRARQKAVDNYHPILIANQTVQVYEIMLAGGESRE